MRIVAVLAALYVATSAWVLLCSLKAGSAAIDFDGDDRAVDLDELIDELTRDGARLLERERAS